jgi:glycosyltransferase involved in cell wall biosynthesis
MIVKNEEKVLRRCIQSVSSIVDEAIICDTGSSDSTCNIIQEYGELHRLEFTTFVETKNKALLKPTMDYILWMDADEYLIEGLDRLKMHADAGGANAISAVLFEGEPGDPINVYSRPRMWKNRIGWSFVGPGIHEIPAGPGPVIHDRSVKVRHDHSHRENPDQVFRDKAKLYFKVLEDELEKNPNDRRAIFYLANTHKDIGNFGIAAALYQRYLNTDGVTWRDEQWTAAYYLGMCHKQNGEYDLAREALEKAIAIDPRRAEAYNTLGMMDYNRERWDEAIQWFEKGSACKIPDDVYLFLNPQHYGRIPLDYLSICQTKNKDFRSARATINKLQGLHIYDQRYHYNATFIQGQAVKTIFFLLGETPEPVFGGVLENPGAHGVETTYVELSASLRAMGHKVFLFCKSDAEHIHDGVYYIPYGQLGSYASVNPDIVIASRWFDALKKFPLAHKVLWFQDAFFAMPTDSTIIPEVHHIVCSSTWHRNLIAERLGWSASKEKMQVIPLGIRKAHFIETIRKDPNLAIYSSNPDRGLYSLLEMWPRIVDQVPEIKLRICYGWEGLATWSGDPQWRANVEQQKDRVLSIVSRHPNITLTGRLGKTKLAREMLGASVMLYPNNFWETFCLTALEAQVAGVVSISTLRGALATTYYQDTNILIDGDPTTAEYQSRFIDAAVRVFRDKTLCNDWGMRNRMMSLAAPCDWADVAMIWEQQVLFRRRI